MYKFIGNSKFLVGKDAIKKIPYEMEYFNCSRALIIADSKGQRYLKTFLKKMCNEDLTIDIINVGDNFALFDANCAITKFYECGANSIMALGATSAADLAKSVKYAVSRNLTHIDIEGKNYKTIPSVNNIPLFMIPTDTGCSNVATKRLMLVDELGRKMMFDFDSDAYANAIIIDPSMSRFTRESKVVEQGLYGVLLCLTTLIEDITPIARGYAVAGIKAASIDGYLNYNDHSTQTDRRRASMIVNACGGIASDELTDYLLPILTLAVSEYVGISYQSAYNTLAVNYLSLYVSREPKERLGFSVLFGVDEFLKHKKGERIKALMIKLFEHTAQLRKEFGVKTRLSDYGVVADDLAKIYEITLNSQRIMDEETNRRTLMELLNRSL